MRTRFRFAVVLAFLAVAGLSGPAWLPESRPLAQPAPAPGIENALFVGLRWRSIGPSVPVDCRRRQQHAATRLRRDRRRAVEDQRWRRHVRAVSDGFFKTSSVGAVAVSESNPDVVYAGMGEVQLRGNVIRGDGIYKSSDGGGPGRTPASRRQWSSAASASTANPDIVYVAALGDPYGPNPERGVYKTTDGGKTWTSVLSRNDKTGAADLAMDRRTPRSSMPDAGRSSARRIRYRAAARAAACSRQRTAATRGRS